MIDVPNSRVGDRVVFLKDHPAYGIKIAGKTGVINKFLAHWVQYDHPSEDTHLVRVQFDEIPAQHYEIWAEEGEGLWVDPVLIEPVSFVSPFQAQLAHLFGLDRI